VDQRRKKGGGKDKREQDFAWCEGWEKICEEANSLAERKGEKRALNSGINVPQKPKKREEKTPNTMAQRRRGSSAQIFS